jgi:RNA polymerase sigma-70 factor, ECF subfamily
LVHHDPVQGRDFERLYDEHAQPLLGFLVYRTGDRALAEDIIADTFERVLRKSLRFDPRRGSEKTWIYTIALTCLRDHSRRQAAESRALDRVSVPTSSAGEDYDAVDERDRLKRGLAKLSEEEREAVSLRYGADLTLPEMVKILREPHTTVHGRVHRALRKLRAEID